MPVPCLYDREISRRRGTYPVFLCGEPSAARLLKLRYGSVPLAAEDAEGDGIPYSAIRPILLSCKSRMPAPSIDQMFDRPPVRKTISGDLS
jgi:hypothetical protein